MRTVEKRKRADLKPDPGQPRKFFMPELLLKMGKSLMARQIVPLLIRPDNTIIDGEQRWQAAGLVGLEWLDVIVAEGNLTATDLRLIQVTSAMLRADLTAPEQSDAVAELLHLNPTWKNTDVAEHLDIDPATVTRLLSPFKCIPEVQEAYRAGSLTISDVYEYFKLTADEQRAAMASGVKGRGAIATLRRKAESAAVPAVKQSRVVVPLTSGLRVTVQGPDMDLDALIEALQTALENAKKASKDSLNVKTAEKVWKDRCKAGA